MLYHCESSEVVQSTTLMYKGQQMTSKSMMDIARLATRQHA